LNDSVYNSGKENGDYELNIVLSDLLLIKLSKTCSIPQNIFSH